MNYDYFEKKLFVINRDIKCCCFGSGFYLIYGVVLNNFKLNMIAVINFRLIYWV